MLIHTNKMLLLPNLCSVFNILDVKIFISVPCSHLVDVPINMFNVISLSLFFVATQVSLCLQANIFQDLFSFRPSRTFSPHQVHKKLAIKLEAVNKFTPLVQIIQIGSPYKNSQSEEPDFTSKHIVSPNNSSSKLKKNLRFYLSLGLNFTNQVS